MSKSLTVSQDRLEGLTIFRVILVTVFLLAALIFDVGSISTLTEARSTALLTLIVGTYLLSIVYSIVIRKMNDVTSLAIIQVCLDLVTIAVLVAITGGLDSVFIFLFHLSIVNAASISGKKIGNLIATITTLILASFVVAELGYLQSFFPSINGAERTGVWFRMLVMSGAGYALAFLAGYLSDRVGEMRSKLEQQERSASEQQALNEHILDGISSGVVTIDESETIIFFNKAAVQITGMKKSFALGLSLERAFPEIAKSLREIGEKIAWDSLSSKRMEAEYRTQNGKPLYLGFSLSPLKIGEDAKGLIIIFQNLTEIRQLEKNVQRNRRLAAVGELAASIAHEIRNPLAAISGSVEMLEQDSSVTSDSHVLHGIVLREVERLNILVSDFLNYSRPRPLEIQKVDLSILIDEFIILSQNKNADLEIEVKGLERDTTINADAEVLKQVLWNLVNNGYEAMKGKGTLVLEISNKKGQFIFAVEDDGPGIRMSERERIFEPFYTTKSTGTGLGLATIFRLIEEHGGDIKVLDAEHLSGARFEFSMGKA